jgi:Arylsulfotransferase (ASST)
MTGELLHEWFLPYSAVWDDSAAVRHPQPDSQIYVEKAQLLPNGDLVAIYVAVGDSPWGYGMVKMDKDSKVVWKYLEQTHHDFDIAADGKIYALTHAIRTDVVASQEHLVPPRIDDYAVELSPDGRELKKVWLLGALATSPYATFLSTVPWYIAKGKGDYLHTNSIDVISPEVARRLPVTAADEVLLSFREIGTLALLDLDRQQIVWALRGPWLRQHDAEALPDGHMMVFDNEGHGGDVSRVLEFDPSTLQIAWSYAGDPEHAFFSRVRSSEQRLPNGNTLITESDGGRLLEVTPGGAIVWEYLNPVRGGEAGDLIPILSWGQRIDPAGLDPGFRELLTH